MAAQKLRGALVGFGQVAEKAHVPALLASPDCDLVAVADESPARLASARASLPGARAYPTLDALLSGEPELDFVDIATPPFLHARQARAALNRGCHVLCEKPLTLTVEEFEDLRARAAAADRALYTVHNWAYAPQWLKIFELAAAGRLGEIRHAALSVLRSSPAVGALPGDWRRDPGLSGGGILVDHGWHALYLLHRILGGAPARVSARLGAGAADKGEDEATVFLEYPSAAAVLHLSWRSPLRRNSAVIHGSRATLELDDDQIRLVSSAAPAERFDFPEKLSAGSAHPSWFAASLADFLAAVGDPAARARSAEEAEFCLKTIHRVYQSVRVGRNPLREALRRPHEGPRAR